MNQSTHTIRGNVVDPLARTITPAEVEIQGNRIAAIRPVEGTLATYLLPGFIDAHIHVESSMLTPGEFARAAVVHGTVATVSDPHEIANVLGVAGVEFMLAAAESVPLKIYFGVPSCVPATTFETAGATLDADAVAEMLADSRLRYLSEMMNYPGVLTSDEQVMAKITAAQRFKKPIDGHAPGLRGAKAAAYVQAGISTDHECTTKAEALDKLAAGAKILIRQGSAARNFDALYTLIDEYPETVMFCSDDKHPDALQEGHIDVQVRKAVARGQDVMNVLRCACINPIAHYGLNVGQLRVDDLADFVEVTDLESFRVVRTFVDGNVVAQRGQATFLAPQIQPQNHFEARRKSPSDFRMPTAARELRVIVAIEGELITKSAIHAATNVEGHAVSNTELDILKIAVVNRYHDAAPALAFIKNFGFKRGAIASSVAHDCHNIVAVGVSDDDLCRAVNAIVDNKGGLAVVDGDETRVLPLPVAGLMSTESCQVVGDKYRALNEVAQHLGTPMKAPFMTLSFMALLVIPSLKLSDKGLFDAERFEFVSPFVP